MKKLSISAMLFAVGLVLPFLTGQIKSIGNMLLPMHIPVLLCGLICGWKYGGVVGFLLPLTRSLLFGRPYLYPDAIGMAFELLTYGLLVGLLYERARWKCIRTLYRSLIIAMLAGRAVWGVMKWALLGFSGEFTLGVFVTSGFTKAFPGILLQLILVPAVMVALGRAKLIPLFHKSKKREEEHGV